MGGAVNVQATQPVTHPTQSTAPDSLVTESNTLSYQIHLAIFRLVEIPVDM